MWLEIELLKNPEWAGVFCVTTSYREEKNPIAGRHELIFPMFEFESKGDFNALKDLEVELLKYLGFGLDSIVEYEDMCKKYDYALILENEHEQKMWDEVGSSLILQHFPLRTNPFWNMKKTDGQIGIFNKADVILFGQETIGSAERSCDVEEMRKMFYSIEEGRYSDKLFELFGKERVEKELEEFLSLDFFPRFGAGIGLTRLARAYALNV
jgi:aspartyl/asparaginyl-tRNA synthetase